MELVMRMDGLKSSIAKLRLLKRSKAKAIWKKAVRAGAAELLKIARPLVATDSKALVKSLAIRIKARRRDGTVFGIVGARRKFTKGKRKPSRYSHLVEKGRKAYTRTGRNGSYTVGAVNPRPFLGRAVRSGKGRVMDAMIAKINSELANAI